MPQTRCPEHHLKTQTYCELCDPGLCNWPGCLRRLDYGTYVRIVCADCKRFVLEVG